MEWLAILTLLNTVLLCLLTYSILVLTRRTKLTAEHIKLTAEYMREQLAMAEISNTKTDLTFQQLTLLGQLFEKLVEFLSGNYPSSHEGGDNHD